jgi:hypothetical protein
MLCPSRHLLKRHRRRDSRYQYYCVTCDQYFTENSLRRTIKAEPGYYDAFIEDYIKFRLAGKKRYIAELCTKHFLSRASLYRQIFSKENKPLLDMLAQLSGWAKLHLNGIYKRQIDNQQLVLNHKSSLKGIRLTLKPEKSASGLGIRGIFNADISRFVSKSQFVKFSADKRSCYINFKGETPPLSVRLDPIAKILKAY